MALLSHTSIVAGLKRRSGNMSLPILALCWVSVAWGTTWLASKIGVSSVPALQMSGIRQLIGGVCYVAFFLYKKAPWPNGRQWLTILILSFLNFMLSNGLSTWGIKYIPSGLGAIIGAIFPLWIVVITAFRGDRLPVLAIVGMLMGFGGVCIIFYDHLKDFLQPDFRFGIWLSITATISWAIGTLYTKKKAASFNPYFSLGLQMVISGAVLLGISHNIDGYSIPLTHFPARAWWAIAYLVVIGSVLTFIAYLYCLQRLPAALASIYAYINPVIAVLLGALYFQEAINGWVVVGGLVTIFGVYVVNRVMRRER